MIKLIECPRDAIQGIPSFIPTPKKAAYINHLLQVGFSAIDFGSFVSPKAIPQLRDTKEVLSMLDLSNTATELLAITANLRGVEEACNFAEISYIGFPFSVSETFQQRNTNSSIAESLNTIADLLNTCKKHDKEAVIYLSMGFGNPYGDKWGIDILEMYAEKLVNAGAKILALSDTIGISNPTLIREIFPFLLQKFKEVEWGLHLHARADDSEAKLEAAIDSGCRRIDSAIGGFGGCPMATDVLTGNIATEAVVNVLQSKKMDHGLNISKLGEAGNLFQELISPN